jgi:type IV pilus assembly protein PilC
VVTGLRPLGTRVRPAEAGRSRAGERAPHGADGTWRARGGGFVAPFGRRVGARDLALLCRQLGTMLDAGVPVVSALELLAGARRTAGQRMLRRVAEAVREGGTLTSALRREERLVSPMMAHMFEAGEASGSLVEICGRLADHFEREAALATRVRSALLYPAIVVAVAAGVLLLMMTVVLPQFASLFAQIHVRLPRATETLLRAGDWLRRSWRLALPAAGALASAAWALAGSRRVRRRLEGVLLLAPALGPLVRGWTLARFSRTLATLLRGGVTLLDALPIVGRALDNRPMTAAVERARRQVQRGGLLGRALAEAGLFPPMLVQMVTVGEETGALDALLEKAAEFYERDVGAAVDRLTTVLEPALTLVLGGAVALVLAAVLLPAFDAFGRFQG